LYKIDTLCSNTATALRFARRGTAPRGVRGDAVKSHSAMAWPWRAVWRVNTRRNADVAQFLISVPKKRLRHAVDRVTMRRRCREAYRLSRHLLPQSSRLDIAFIYVGDSLTPYDRTAASMTRLLGRMAATVAPSSPPAHDETDSAGNK
ncbi:MAG: ribonuclease P protein component, partial [Paramuribaculum sp.]|nr:ribonuclease P protein component [Paramuribaculum sp.]